ncbi:DnaD domain protein [Enterococcus dongliensis]|uniref:DnaD domain protein n=1 Tax=Enterococcus dongliensis TaxID=2559925 RepID=UPI00288D27DA|nr:DnaD domain protein [Enterococcus dongliensis]MDT2641773.1 DnaD domain protein [Enterococcus dongliensis]
MHEKNILSQGNIMAQGYGIVPKVTMRDTKLSIESKAIYAYLCSFAGAGNTAFPSRELICHELNISINRFNKYKNELVAKGYITIKRERLENGFSKNIYTLVNNVGIQNVDIGNEDIRNVDIQSVDIGNEDTNINSFIINNLNNNNSKSNSSSKEESLKPIFTFWEQNGFGTMSPLIIEHFTKWVEDFKEIGATTTAAIELIIHSLVICVERGKRNYGYAKAILTDWEQQRYLTVDQVKAEDKKNSSSNNKRQWPDYSIGNKLENTGSSEYDNLGW